MTDITNAGDLRTAYLQAFDSFSLTPGDIVESSEGRVNMRYARELLGTLVTANLLTVTDVNGEEDVWQVSNPGTYDNHTREEAEAVIDQWLSSTNPTESGSKPAAKKKDTKMNTKTPDTVHPCYCGCGENVPSKSFYRPGHDARHAGVVGRKIAANATTPGFDRRELLNDLPSDRLIAKAEAIAEKAMEKADAKIKREAEKAAAKAAKTEPQPEEGIVKVGKAEYAATRLPDGTVKYFKGDEEKVASKSAAATFTTE